MNQRMDNEPLIENTAQEFWALAGAAPIYPCALDMPMLLNLPLAIYAIKHLRVRDVTAWMRSVGIEHCIAGRDRRLHGCLVANRGMGAIFYDAEDTEEEQRFTLAHELAHFLLDYQAPRQRAIAILGETILPVLDGERMPTPTERLHAVLGTVALGTMSHCMERPGEGLPGSAVLDIEDRANRLALELLAPAALLTERLQLPTIPRGFKARLYFLTRLLTGEHGLPANIAAAYARFLLRKLGEPTFRDWLFETIE
jgi:hypothetical protein